MYIKQHITSSTELLTDINYERIIKQKKESPFDHLLTKFYWKSKVTCTGRECEALSPGRVPLPTQSTLVELGDRLAECVSGRIVTREAAVGLTVHGLTSVVHSIRNSWDFTVKSCQKYHSQNLSIIISQSKAVKNITVNKSPENQLSYHSQ
jgi:hypothetical protein